MCYVITNLGFRSMRYTHKHFHKQGLFLSIALAMLSLSNTQAAIIMFDDLGFNNGAFVTGTGLFGGNSGTLVVSSSATGAVRTSNYTVTDLDFNNDGTNDTLTFVITQTGSGAGVSGINATNAGVGTVGNGFNAINGAEVLTLAFLNPVVTLGGATTQTATASMFAFTGATTAGAFGAPQVSIDGGLDKQ